MDKFNSIFSAELPSREFGDFPIRSRVPWGKDKIKDKQKKQLDDFEKRCKEHPCAFDEFREQNPNHTGGLLLYCRCPKCQSQRGTL